MSELTTYCSDCLHNHTDKCMDARKNSWHCPDYVKKMSEHEKHIMRIAESVNDIFEDISSVIFCPIAETVECGDASRECKQCVYDWMMSLKDDTNDSK